MTACDGRPPRAATTVAAGDDAGHPAGGAPGVAAGGAPGSATGDTGHEGAGTADGEGPGATQAAAHGGTTAAAPPLDPLDLSLRALWPLLRGHGGQGFERYKPGTVRRRVGRRMALHGLSDPAAYVRLVAASATERDLLAKEMLIGVTGFFRDPPAWALLARTLRERAAAGDAAAGPLRAWCAGCSTGEEPYSLAMTWLDLAHEGAAPRPLRIFATDLGGDAVALAQRGRFALERLHGVSPGRLARHFDVDADGRTATVSRAVREQVLFARHDMTVDPPFGQLDLLLCRNLLIYLERGLQRELLQLFHDVLKPGGLLMLGQTETADLLPPRFEALDPHLRLYRRGDRDPARRAMLRIAPLPDRPPTMTTPLAAAPPRGDLPALAERLVLRQHAPAAVLVNPAGDLLWQCGPTERYFEPAAGRMDLNVLGTALPSLRAWLAGALREAQLGRAQPVELRGLRLAEAGRDVFVDLVVQPLRSADALDGLVLVVLRGAAAAAPVGGTADPRAGDAAGLAEPAALLERVRALEQALQVAGEDHLAAHEELQSGNEELTISREEMQSMNEELQTVNAELQAKLDTLAFERADMAHLLESTQIATLFLDGELNVRRFTEQARRLVNLREGDAGRPLSDLTTRLQYPGLVEQAAQVLRTLTPSEVQRPAADGRWYAVRIVPYRTAADAVAGVVVTFTDTSRSDASQRARLGVGDGGGVPPDPAAGGGA